MRRSEALRVLNRFEVTRLVDKDWRPHSFRVKPRGFGTILFTVQRTDHVADRDFDEFMCAVMSLCDTPAPVKRS